MSMKLSTALAITLALVLVLASAGRADGPVPQGDAARRPRQAPPVAEAASSRPQISLIEAAAPTCYRATLDSNTCLINWGRISVSTASPATIDHMTLTIDGQMRARYQGFFQSAMEVTRAFHGEGFAIPCGAAGVDGVPGMGHAYDWTLRAVDSGGLDTTSSGTVVCPALDPSELLVPVVWR